MRGAIAAVAALAVAACAPGADVVARAADAGSDESAVGKADPAAAVDPSCGPPSTTIAVTTKANELYVFDLATGAATGGPLKDLSFAVGPIAVSRSGGVWMASGGVLWVIDPPSLASKKIAPMSADAMAFVWDAKTATEKLYAVDGGVLSALDTTLLVPSPVAKLSPPLADLRGLAGTLDGELLAFAGDPVVTIATVDPRDGTVTPRWVTKSPDGSRFGGAAPTQVGLELLFGARAWAFDGSAPTFDRELFADDRGVVSVAASPCAPFGLATK